MPGSNSGSNDRPEVHTNISDSKNTVTIAVHNPGQHPLSPSAGQPLVAAKGAASQVISVHGSIAGVVFDNQVTK